MMNNDHKIINSLAFSALLLIAPLAAAHAASPQKNLNAAIQHTLDLHQALRLDGQLKLSVELKKKKRPSVPQGAFQLDMTSNMASVKANGLNTDGSLRLTVLAPDKTNTLLSALKEPIALDWKYLEPKDLYLRVPHIPSFLSSLSSDTPWSKIENVWIKAELTTSTKSAYVDFAKSYGGSSTNELSKKEALAIEFIKQQPLNVARVEKKWTDGQGHVFERDQVVLNPDILARLATANLDGLKGKQRIAVIKSNKIQEQAIKKELKDLHLAITVDTTAAMITGVDFSTQQSTPHTSTKNCRYQKKTGAVVCPTDGQTLLKLSGNVHWKTLPAYSVVAPADFITTDQVQTLLAASTSSAVTTSNIR